jgi:hypothetical protein
VSIFFRPLMAPRRGLRQVAVWLRQLRRGATAAKTHNAPPESLLVRWQIDSSFWRGSLLLGAMVAGEYALPVEAQAAVLVGAVKAFRAVGVSSATVPDSDLLRNTLHRNYVAYCNIILASPLYYGLWHFVHNAGVGPSAIRSLVGTIRAAPIFAALYGSCVVLRPIVTDRLLRGGADAATASLGATALTLVCAMAPCDGLAEFRGVGVPGAAIPLGTLVCFMASIVGRLATGVLVQQRKVGTEFRSALPEQWREASSPQWALFTAFEALRIDADFLLTLGGTSVFQYVLNAITFVLLTKGAAGRLPDVGRYLTGGLTGTPGGAATQFGRTVGMRFGFCTGWNRLSARPTPEPAAVTHAARQLHG